LCSPATAAFTSGVFLLVSRVDRHVVLTASVFAVVGGLVGLMGWLRTQTGAERAVEDFGLASARLVASPLFSGLAAGVGVLIVGLAHLNVGNISLGPAPAGGAAVPSLGSIFSVTSNPTGFVAAAIFGLTPGLLLDYLQTP